MKNLYKIALIPVLLTVMISCKKNILEENPPAIITAENLYNSYSGFQNGLNGLYNEVRRVRAGLLYGQTNDLMLEVNVIGVDNSYGNWASAPENVYNNWGAQSNAAYSGYSTIWAYLYETINAANTIIDRATASAVMSTDQKNQVLAESRCIRAWAYRHLTYLWGDVPLNLHESTGTNIRTDWDRTPVADVRAAMEADWLFAEQYLPVTNMNDGKLIKGVPQHYLAELYLAEGKNDKAKDYAGRVTQNPAYALINKRYGVNVNSPGTIYTDMFLDGNSDRSQGNTEALWVFQNELNVTGGEGYNIMRRYWVNRYTSLSISGKFPIAVSADNGGNGIGRLGPTKFALDLYGSTDDRGGNFSWRYYWIINTTDPKNIPTGKKLGDTIFLNRTAVEKLSNANWPSPRKWDYASPINVNVTTQYNDQAYIRSAETYLLLAEADFNLGDLQGAATAINALRARAHATLITPAQVTLDFILDERSRELFSEEDRRYTLLRTNTWLTRTKLHNAISGPLITDRDKLLPIPQDVIDANITKKFPQNPGY